ncbi:MAG: hypothetical protein M1826_005518 [Phylliscum demangeonii]|nr:MAG: hypothetical protein M1826_005518 [Phylliscum demangeonii]
MASSELVLATIKESYKQARREGDLNQPLSVQAWGQDGLHRRYWLIEGRDDTDFRLYREGNVELQNPDWRAVAGDIEELKSISSKLSEDGSQAARRLSERITSALPRFEAIQEKRKRREYRQSRKAQFVRPEPGFSLYEGRTRGKKGKYVFSSEDDDEDQVKPAHRASARSRHSGSPYAAEAPVFTASGRQVKARQGGVYGESMLSGQSAPQQPGSFRESRRSGLRNRSAQGSPPAGSHIQGYNAVDEMVDDEEDAASSGADADADDYEAGNGDDEIDDDSGPDDMSDASDLDDDERPAKRARRSLIVKLLLSEKAQAIANGYFPAEVPQNEGRAMAGEPNGNLLEKNGSNDLPGPEMGGELPKQDLAEAVVLKPLPAEKALEQLNGYSVSKPGLQEVPAQLAIENNGGTPFEKIPLPTQLLEKALEPVNTDVSGLPAGDGVVDAAKPSADAASANGHHPQPEPMAS